MFLGVLYFINYLDRTNISFAGPNGMNTDLGLSQTMFGLASGLFFIGYLLLEVPSNMALHRFGARRWIARIMVSWGIVATAITWVPSAGWLYALRFILGIAEAGFFPGIIFYLTFWFPQKDRTRIVALFMLAIPLSSAIGAPVSSLIISAGHGIFGLEGWRTMFLFEGIPAVVFGVICWFYLTDRPKDAHWLPEDERAALVTAMDEDESGQGVALPRVGARVADPPPGVGPRVRLLRRRLRAVCAGLLPADDHQGLRAAVRHQLRHRRARLHQRDPLRAGRGRHDRVGPPR